MKWCPKCHRISMEYDSFINHERCLWRDCFYINKNDMDLDKAFETYLEIYGTSFPEFEKYLVSTRKATF